SNHLRVMGEPPISCGLTDATETYRFLWLRAFHRPIAVRVSRGPNGIRLVAAELTGAGGYNPGGIAARTEKSLSGADWGLLSASLSKASFWNMPTHQAEATFGVDGSQWIMVRADGSQWIIEGRRGGEYHIVDRWTPRDSPYREVGLKFLKLAGISVPERDLY